MAWTNGDDLAKPVEQHHLRVEDIAGKTFNKTTLPGLLKISKGFIFHAFPFSFRSFPAFPVAPNHRAAAVSSAPPAARRADAELQRRLGDPVDG